MWFSHRLFSPNLPKDFAGMTGKAINLAIVPVEISEYRVLGSWMNLDPGECCAVMRFCRYQEQELLH
jgi:hypothetical protein